MEIPCRMLLMRQQSVTCCAHPFAALDKDLFSGPFSRRFSSWLLANLALISQLPFGAQHRLDDFISVVLTVGSQALAGHSLFITLFNSRWIHHQFTQSVDYPNSRFAVTILNGLQQVSF